MILPTWLQLTWAFIKKYWQVFATIAVFAFIYFWTKSSSTSLAEKLAALNATHDEEIKKIIAARDEEIKKRLENEARYQQQIKQIQDQYEKAKIELDARTKKQVETIVKDYGDDEVKLAEQIAKVTGFTLVMPNSGDKK
jgi:Spy/CpxP family protein refolding chaperone